MEAWRKQCLLAYCGYYPYKDIDDDWVKLLILSTRLLI